MNDTCVNFERWLDAALPAADAAGALAHAGACPRCAALLELERALCAAPVAAVRPAFTQVVLDRVRAAERERSLAAVALSAAEPWWLAVLLQPGVLLALFAAALLASGADRLWRIMLHTGGAITAWASPLLAAVGDAFVAAPAALMPAHAGTALASAAWLSLCLSLGLALAWPLFRLSERLVGSGLPRAHYPRAAH